MIRFFLRGPDLLVAEPEDCFVPFFFVSRPQKVCLFSEGICFVSLVVSPTTDGGWSGALFFGWGCSCSPVKFPFSFILCNTQVPQKDFSSYVFLVLPSLIMHDRRWFVF